MSGHPVMADDSTGGDCGGPAGDRNPFATRYTRPGALAYFFDPGVTAEGLVQRLRAVGWRGEIVGPHGSGKSTLLATLAPLLRAAGCTVVETALHDEQRRLPRAFWRAVRAGCPAGGPLLLVVDGYEQLGWLERWLLGRWTRSRKAGLFVTAHRPTGLPRLLTTEATLDRATRIVEHLAAGTALVIAPADLARRLERHHGNLREVLMELYDVWEERQK